MADRLAEVKTLAGWLGMAMPGSTDPQVGLINETRATVLLNGASALVRAYTGNDYEGDVPEAVEVVVLSVAARAYTNPGGVVSQTTGPYAASWDAKTAEGMYLSDADKATLDGLARGRSAYWVLRPDGGPRGRGGRYVPVVGGGDPVPWDGDLPMWYGSGFNER